MHRTELIQNIIDRGKKKTYLEIGVNNGSTFFRIKCNKKIAVDPEFVFKTYKKHAWKILNPTNFRNSFFNTTSNSFFKNEKEFLLKQKGIDVVFIDGLHTFKNSLEDILNAITYLKEDGFIVVHDCFPPHKAASIPTKTYPTKEEQNIEGWTGAWCGDVWKSMVYLKRHLSNTLNISVYNSDYGLGLITLKNKPSTPIMIDNKLFNDIDKLTYDELIKNPKSFINIKNVSNKLEIFNNLYSR
ncbi:class I SAM-dependent methyltransferase [Pontimicrobium sp. IMCC45349]|uniref:class I SAM-dependent methyltransferase n=1 Tax=Pontimicrobium sp. IMCC45349 TaxID=3391574 RepID=UPI00399EEBDB